MEDNLDASAEFIQTNREKWTFRGTFRPDFALEPGPEQESVWDYPRPPKMVEDQRLIIVRSAGAIIAQTERALKVCETAGPPVFYIPPADIDFVHLTSVPITSLCEWKGTATYWSLAANLSQLIGWSYPTPFPEFKELANYVSFYPARVQCTLNGEGVRPQPGNLYGGWVTDEIVGPFKGEPGTEDW